MCFHILQQHTLYDRIFKKPLFDTILDYIPAPEGEIDAPLQLLVSSIDYNDYVGRIGIGRIERGVIRQNQEAMICNYHDRDKAPKKTKIVSISQIDGLRRIPVTEAKMGDIICFSGAEEISIGDTITAVDCVEPLEFVKAKSPQLRQGKAVSGMTPYSLSKGLIRLWPSCLIARRTKYPTGAGH